MLGESFISLLRYYADVEASCENESHYFNDLLKLAEQHSAASDESKQRNSDE